MLKIQDNIEIKEIEELNSNYAYDFNHLLLKINELVKTVNKLIKGSEEKQNGN